jgi:hypothetical protein
MKDSELENRVNRILDNYQSIEITGISKGWEESLIDKIATEKGRRNTNLSVTKIALSVFIIVINTVFIYKALNNNQSLAEDRSSDLQIISKELLINPSSISN